ncbi:unnamed protein product, partial [Rotaria sp. Silwood1]
MPEYSNVEVTLLDDQLSKDRQETNNVLSVKKDTKTTYSLIFQRDSSDVLKISVDKSFESIRSGSAGIIISLPKQKHLTYLLKFSTREDATSFNTLLGFIRSGKDIDDFENSQFDERTDDFSAEQYFHFYSCLSQQQNMMQDYIRTSTYQRAILDNAIDFSGK